MSSRRGGRGKRRIPKHWVPVIALDLFRGEKIGAVLMGKPESVIGRVLEVTLRDLTGSFEHEKYKLYYRVTEVEDGIVYGRFCKAAISRDFRASMIRRRSSLVELYVDSKTSDEIPVRHFHTIVTRYRIRTSMKRAIRKLVSEKLLEIIPTLTLDEYVKSVLFGSPIKLNEELAQASRKICPIKNVDLRKLLRTDMIRR
uniref:Ribosomal protein S3AE n=1 Tax=uncultured korarchaeote TaxID=161241 RepID=A0A1L2JM21_9CREN|nr:ribosomal protein S3AE [uncultured korarchaeote]